jgi:hypothetical protein
MEETIWSACTNIEDIQIIRTGCEDGYEPIVNNKMLS